MINEQTIEKCIEDIGNSDTDWLEAMSADQPVIAGFLAAEDHEAFTEAEIQYLYYIAVVCWKCFEETYTEIEEIDEESLSRREEQNWNRIDSLRPASLKIIIDRIMLDYPEQEVLYYLEDALQLDEEDPENPITKSGQIPMFVTLLTLVDMLSEARGNLK
ncbi:MAG: hypothetical protein ABI761_05315 [Saprospiraceae bacterium]